jgi:D-glycero-D-manno-heptose 1,7-bisphosphate phosphatase
VTAAVFLDRDGVLNHLVDRNGTPVSPRLSDDFHLIDGAMGAVRMLHEAGYACVVVTNQPDLGRGLMAQTELDAMHDRLGSAGPFAGIYVCPHGTDDACSCRKPKSGLLITAAAELNIDLEQSWMIGDRWVDIVAGMDAGCRSVLIEHAFSLAPTSSGSPVLLAIEASVPDLISAAKIVLASARSSRSPVGETS